MRLKQLSNPLRVGKGLLCLLALFVMLLAPQGAWAEPVIYDLWVGDVQVTSDNAANVLSSETTTVAFDTENNILTLNNLSVFPDDAEPKPYITNGLANLTINLVGENIIRGNNTYFLAKSGNGEGNNTVTFTTSATTSGSLEFYGANYDPWYTGHTLNWSNGLGWRMGEDSDYGSYVGISSIGLTIDGTLISNGSTVIGESTFLFNSETNTLTLNGVYITGGVVWSSSDDLTVNLVGNSSVGGFPPSSTDPIFKGNGGALLFTTSDQTPGSLEVYVTSEMSYFMSGWNTTTSTPIWHTDCGNDPLDYTWWVDQGCDYMKLGINHVYDLWLDGTQLCSANRGINHSENPNDPKSISFDGSNTLTIQNFSHTTTKSPFIKNGLSNLVIVLFGENTINCGELFLDKKDNNDSDHNVTFKSYESYPGTLVVNTSGGGIAHHGTPTLVNLAFSEEAGDNTRTLSFSEPTSYDLKVGDVTVTSANAGDVKGDNITTGTVSFDAENNILTLNNATIKGRIFSGLQGGLTVHLLGSNVIDGEYEENNTDKPGEIAFVTEDENVSLTFTTNETTPGQLLMKNTHRNGEVSMYYQGFAESMENGLGYSSKDNKRLIAKAPALTPGEGVYWTDQEYTISGPAGATIEYQDYLNKIAKTTYSGEPFTMTTTGKYALGVWQTLTVDETAFTLYGKGGSYIVHNKPTFSPVAGTYDGSQQITLANLPTDLATTGETYPQVWYYLGENTNDSVQIISAEQKIEVIESTKVCVYIIDKDSDKVFKSKQAEAEYIIRQDPGLAFVQGEGPVEVVEYTIGGNDNPEMPTLQNENELAVTYNSSDTKVATINTEGVVTIVGVGETRISATSEQTDVLSEGYAEYPLRVYKGLNHESISVKVDDAIYTGEPIEQDVTVKDGETSINEYVNIVYSDNTELGTATVTITPKTDMDKENYYIGSTTAMFTISYRTLKVGEDVVFAGGQKWATYYNPEENLNLPKGIGAFVATGVGDGVVTVSQIKYIPEGEAVLLNNDTETAGTVVFNSDVDTNLLKHADEDVDAENAVIYGLYNGSFMRVKGTIPAGKNYLQVMTLVNNLPSNQPQAPELTIVFEGGVTEVKGVKEVREVKDNTFFTLYGRKVQKPSKKGLYINEGRKVVVK